MFKINEQLRVIYIDDKAESVFEAGKNCDSINVVMENGQMAGVPWFEVWKDGNLISKWNADKCQGVAYLTPETEE